MPNWCNNQINIWGNGVTAIKKILEEGGQMFQLLVGGNPQKWGCKWDVEIDMNDLFLDDEQIIMTIRTAWSPCNGFLKMLHEKYGVECENDYNESGNDFAGRYTIDSNGEKDECYEYLEGLYHFDYESFIYEVECLMDGDVPPLEEWLEQFPYVQSKRDLETIYECYK